MAGVCFLLVFLGITGTVPLFTVIGVSILGSRFILSQGATLQTHKEQRREVFRKNPALVWKFFAVSLVVPLALAIFSYYQMGIDYDASLLVFLGLNYLGLVLTNQMILPYLQKVVPDTFD